MSDIHLNTAVNQHFLDKLIRLAGAKAVTATQDIVDVHGVRVMARGGRVTEEHLEALSGRKLKQTIESCFRWGSDPWRSIAYSTFSLDSAGSDFG